MRAVQVTEQPLVNFDVAGDVTLGVHVEDLVRFVQAVLSVSVNGGPVPLGVPGPDAVLVLSPAPKGGCLVLQHMTTFRCVNFTRNISPQGWVRAELFILIINSPITNDAVKFTTGVTLAEPTFIRNLLFCFHFAESTQIPVAEDAIFSASDSPVVVARLQLSCEADALLSTEDILI